MRTKKELEQEIELRRLKRLATRRPRQIFCHIDPIALKLAFRTSGLKQSQISKITKIHNNSLSGFVTGKYNPSKEEVQRICKALKITQKSIKSKRIEVLL